MKIIALLLLILGLLLTIGLGLMSLVMVVTSIGTPGALDKPGGLFLVLIPLFAFLVVLIFAGQSYRTGNYTHSALFGSVFVVAIVGMSIFGKITDRSGLKTFQAMEAQAVEEARLHPIYKFTRLGKDNADTITVLPGRMVVYRVYSESGLSYAGTVGDLNESRDTLIISSQLHGELTREDLFEFVDEQGRKLTDVFVIQ